MIQIFHKNSKLQLNELINSINKLFNILFNFDENN